MLVSENVSNSNLRKFLWSLTVQRVFWQESAPCFRSAELFGDNFLDSRISRQESLAEKYCLDCHYRLDCLVSSLVSNELYGLWGGVTEKGRVELIASLKAAVGDFEEDWDDEIQYHVLLWCKEWILANQNTVI